MSEAGTFSNKNLQSEVKAPNVFTPRAAVRRRIITNGGGE